MQWYKIKVYKWKVFLVEIWPRQEGDIRDSAVVRVVVVWNITRLRARIVLRAKLFKILPPRENSSYETLLDMF